MIQHVKMQQLIIQDDKQAKQKIKLVKKCVVDNVYCDWNFYFGVCIVITRSWLFYTHLTKFRKSYIINVVGCFFRRKDGDVWFMYGIEQVKPYIPFVFSSTCVSTNSRAHLSAKALQDNQPPQASNTWQQGKLHPVQTSLR